MNGHDTDHTSRLGMSHPHNDLTHGHTEKVFDKDCEGWMIEWMEWILKMSYDDSPLFGKQVNTFAGGYDNLRPSKEDREQGVLFLAAPMYGASGNSNYNNYQIVPLGKWHIFFSPFVIYNSKLEYPSLTDEELFNLAKNQVDSVYRLEVLVDGINTECCRVPIDLTKKATIKSIPYKNILGVTREELDIDNTLTALVDGFACFLKPLPPGLHIISFKGYSRTYYTDTQIQLNVRGPRKKDTA